MRCLCYFESDFRIAKNCKKVNCPCSFVYFPILCTVFYIAGHGDTTFKDDDSSHSIPAWDGSYYRGQIWNRQTSVRGAAPSLRDRGAYMTYKGHFGNSSRLLVPKLGEWGQEDVVSNERSQVREVAKSQEGQKLL